jgi:hypothetical protein
MKMADLVLDIEQCLHFLDMLDPGGRHTIASEAPFGGPDNGPKWEPGATFEAWQRKQLIKDIQERQSYKSNVYYSVNRPCKVSERQGWWGKNNIDDIIAIRALGFDIDFTSFQRDQEAVLTFIDKNLVNELKPSMIINTGGGFHLIYFLSETINIHLHRPANTDEEKAINAELIKCRSAVTNLSHDFEHLLRTKLEHLPIKVDNMSNIDRVLRLPGTVNYPKLEKQEKGQMPALAHISIDNCRKIDILQLRDIVPLLQPKQERVKSSFIPRKDTIWTAYKKASTVIEFIRDQHLADTNEWYTHNVMLPLIGAIHDPNEANQLTIEEATELFMEAVSGGERYGTMGRGQGYFMRQWRSHRPELARNGTKSLGGLIWAAQQNGFEIPWKNEVSWEESFDQQAKWLGEQHYVISQANKDLFG